MAGRVVPANRGWEGGLQPPSLTSDMKRPLNMPKAITKAVTPNGDDANLIGMCDQIASLNKNALDVYRSGGTDDMADEFWDPMHLLLEKVINATPKTQEGLRRKALAMFRIGWQTHCGGETLDDKIVFALLKDIGVKRTELPKNI